MPRLIPPLMMALALMLLPSRATAQAAPTDPYREARAIVADIGRVVTPGGVQDTFEVTLGGARQVVNVRGADRANPIMLFVHGGPGSVEMPIAWSFQRPWEDYFTMVQWDQRGAGRSFPLNDPKALAGTLTFERYRDDTIELIEQLRRKYGKRKVFVMGHSWGSLVGVAVAAKRPDLLHGYVGIGQMIDVRENERVGMAWALERARAAGNAVAVREIEALKPYPDGAFTIDKADAWRKWAIGYGSLAAHRPNADFYFRSARLSPEYTAADINAWSDGSAYTVANLWPRLIEVSMTPVDRLDVPVVLLLGRLDYTTPSSIAERWMAALRAPSKRVVWFEHSAHLPMLEEPGRVFAALLEHVRPHGREDVSGKAAR